jgi:hypothetical protein
MMTDTFDAVWASIEPSFAGRSAEIGDARLALARSVLDFYRAGITQPANLQRMCLRSIRLSHDFIRADRGPPERAATASR